MATNTKKEAKKKPLTELGKTYLKYKVCISGAADTTYAPAGTVEKAIEVGGRWRRAAPCS